MSRRARLVVAGIFIATALSPLALSTSPAHAGTYAYWSYWHDTGAGWKYSGCGAYYPQGDCVPADGTIEGWRFTVSSEGGAQPPRYSQGFDAACASTPVMQGKKRVAIVVDFGTQRDASDRPLLARCATGGASDNGGVMLQSKYAVTSSEGFVCTIESYPKSGCGEYVSGSSSSASPTTRPTVASSHTPTATPRPGTSNTAAVSGEVINPATSATGSASTSASPLASPQGGVPVSVPSSSPSEDAGPSVAFGGSSAPSSHGSPLGTIIGIVVVGMGAGAAVVTARRRRKA